MVEHLLAKEDVASSSLVTRSSLRLERSEEQRLERRALALREGGLRRPARSYGWQPTSKSVCPETQVPIHSAL